MKSSKLLLVTVMRSSELTIDEQIEITKLKATYATRRGLSNLKNGVDKLLDSDILKMEKNKK